MKIQARGPKDTVKRLGMVFAGFWVSQGTCQLVTQMVCAGFQGLKVSAGRAKLAMSILVKFAGVGSHPLRQE